MLCYITYSFCKWFLNIDVSKIKNLKILSKKNFAHVTKFFFFKNNTKTWNIKLSEKCFEQNLNIVQFKTNIYSWKNTIKNDFEFPTYYIVFKNRNYLNISNDRNWLVMTLESHEIFKNSSSHKEYFFRKILSYWEHYTFCIISKNISVILIQIYALELPLQRRNENEMQLWRNVRIRKNKSFWRNSFVEQFFFNFGFLCVLLYT